MKIRACSKKDIDDVRFICLNSEGPCTMSEDEKFFILTTYCDYYLENEIDNCFVAVDENDKAVGYIICTEDYDRFIKIFNEKYLTKFSPDSKFYNSVKNSTLLQAKYKEDYPAHMHIDVLPEYQRKGLGHMLVDTLAEHLLKKNIPGLMLTVGESNFVGQGFYKKYGFDLIEQAHGDVAFGISLLKDERKK